VEKKKESNATGIEIQISNPVSEKIAFFASMFSHCTPERQTLNEVDKYLSLQCGDPTVDRLDYWKAHVRQFPNINTVAKGILSNN
jgi:hypothetical protein